MTEPRWQDAPAGDLSYLYQRGEIRTNPDAVSCRFCGRNIGTLAHDPYTQTYQHYPSCQEHGPIELKPREQAIMGTGQGPEELPNPNAVGLTPP